MNRLLIGTGGMLLALGVVAEAQLPSEHAMAQQSATVEIHMNKGAYASGEDIELFLILKPAGDGIYIAKNWGEAGDNIPGFRVILTTLDGKTAQSCGRGAIADYVADAATPTRWLVSEFMYLPAGRFIGWETSLQCPTTEPGKYLVKAHYEPNNPHTHQVAKVPAADGQVLTQMVQAKPVEIEIR